MGESVPPSGGIEMLGRTALGVLPFLFQLLLVKFNCFLEVHPLFSLVLSLSLFMQLRGLHVLCIGNVGI